MTLITGNTYPNRNTIKSMGFTWNKRFQAWQSSLPLTPDQIDALSGLNGIIVNEGNGSKDLIDNRTYKQIYGRCEDAPCCGCCGPQFY